MALVYWLATHLSASCSCSAATIFYSHPDNIDEEVAEEEESFEKRVCHIITLYTLVVWFGRFCWFEWLMVVFWWHCMNRILGSRNVSELSRLAVSLATINYRFLDLHHI